MRRAGWRGDDYEATSMRTDNWASQATDGAVFVGLSLPRHRQSAFGLGIGSDGGRLDIGELAMRARGRTGMVMV